MLGKLLLLALAVWMILLLLKHYRRSLDAPQPKAKSEAQAQDMVACQACGVHLPKSESILKRGAYYCSKEHSEQVDQ